MIMNSVANCTLKVFLRRLGETYTPQPRKETAKYVRAYLETFFPGIRVYFSPSLQLPIETVYAVSFGYNIFYLQF